MAKLILNYSKNDGTYLRDHEVEKCITDLLEWYHLPLESDLREDYHPCTDFGAENVQNLLNPNDQWKNYILSDEWMLTVSQALIIDYVRLLYQQGKFKDIKLIIQDEGRNLALDKEGRLEHSSNMNVHGKILVELVSAF